MKALWVLAAFLLTRSMYAQEAGTPDPRSGWQFAFKDFVIAAWYPPPATEEDYHLVRQAHFNIVMSPRYSLPDLALGLAQKHDLKLMIDTYTANDKPWGGTASEYIPHPTHHPATLPELKWLHERYSDHPALAGYLLGDDYGSLPPELIETSQFLKDNAPHLFPWICQNSFRPRSLADNGNPIGDPQIYPTLYQAHLPVPQQCALLCDALESLRKACNKLDMIPWPMFNITGVESEFLLRFQPYSCLAFGAQGIWYFTYRCLIDPDEAGTPQPLPAYDVVRQVNSRVEAWGPRLLGCRSVGVFGDALPTSALVEAGDGQLVNSADEGIIVGALLKQDEVLAMVVDARAQNDAQQALPGPARVVFDEAVSSIEVIGCPDIDPRTVPGNALELQLRPGEGQLLLLSGEGLKEMAQSLEAPRIAPADLPPLGEDGLMAHWAFDQTEGDIAHDSSGLGNELRLSRPKWTTGVIGGALDLTGEGTIGSVFRARLPNPQAMTVAAWVKPVSYPAEGYGCVLYVGRDSTSRFEFGFGPDNIYPVITNGYGFAHGDLYVSGMRQLIPEGQWGHLAVAAGPDGAKAYVNGKCVRETDFAGVFDFWGDRIELGCRSGSEEFEGLVDDMRIWGRALSDDEVAALSAQLLGDADR